MNNSIGKVLLWVALPMGSVAGSLLLSSCSDNWDDHYAAQSLGNGTLWETMSKNSDVSNFQAVLEACGYADDLDGSQAFTVFAPVNDNFTATMRDSVIALYKAEKAAGVKDSRNKAIKEFVQNHVALYNYSVSSLTNDSIVMMNGKYNQLTANSFEGGSFVASNILTSNGIFYKVSTLADYQPNIYEYLGRDSELDSVGSYIYSYTVEKFYAAQSVPGEIVDGKQTYLDSVTYLSNKLLGWLGANLSVEDSTYWYLAPTNNVWNKLLPQFENYFQFDAQVAGRDSLMFNWPRLAIVLGTAFSRNINTDASVQDSIISTNAVSFARRKYIWGSYDEKYYTYDRPFDEGGILDGTTDVQCSNGVIKKADVWHVDSMHTFMQTILMEGEYRSTLDSVYSKNTSDPTYYSVSSSNPFYDKVSNNRFVQISPTSTSNINVLFNVYDVLSNVAYDVYVVTVPTHAIDTLATALPTKFRAQLYYHDAKGKEAKFSASSDFETDALNVDTVHIGTYTFPTCSYGLEKPQVKMLVQGRVKASDVKAGKYVFALNIDCILFKPHKD